MIATGKYKPAMGVQKLIRIKDAIINLADLSACTRTMIRQLDGGEVVAVQIRMRCGYAISIPMASEKPVSAQLQDALNIIDIVETVWRKAIEEAGS